LVKEILPGAAEEGSIVGKGLDRYGFLRGRHLETAVGDNFRSTRRGGARTHPLEMG